MTIANNATKLSARPKRNCSAIQSSRSSESFKDCRTSTEPDGAGSRRSAYRHAAETSANTATITPNQR